MKSFQRERGALPLPVLVVAAVVLIVAGVVWFVTRGGASDVAVEGHGFEATEPLFLAEPSEETEAPEIPRVEPEADEILKGDLIKFRDRTGAVKFRTREKVAGFNQRGETIWWQPELQVGPSFGSNKIKNKAKALRKKAKPPRLVMRNGRAVMRPNKPTQQQAGDQGDADASGGQAGGAKPPPDVTGGG